MQRRNVVAFIHYIWLLMALVLAGCETSATRSAAHSNPVTRAQVSTDGDQVDLDVVYGAFGELWESPANIPQGGLEVVALVRIGKDGRVLSARIAKASGNLAMDQSVQATLAKVHRVLPAGTNLDREISVNIQFRAQMDFKSMDRPPKSAVRPEGN